MRFPSVSIPIFFLEILAQQTHMPIPITDAVTQTWWVILALSAAIIFTIRQKRALALTKETTQELKGFAILAVLFAHIGYALVDDTRFLFPLSISAGVAVNLFLFLSGYGLAQTSGRESPSPLAFYRKRLSGLYLPLWVTLIVIIALDAWRLGLGRSATEIVQSFLGIFPKADLSQSLNSPLWYFTFIVGHYLLFPLVYRAARPFRSALLFGAIGWLLAFFIPWPIDLGVRSLYQLHVLAFPFGMGVAGIAQNGNSWPSHVYARWQAWSEKRRNASFLIRLGASLVLLVPFVFLSLHAAIGQGVWREQLVSLVTMACLILFFLVKPFESRFLQMMGRYSYEIYLLHWPLLARHDILYASLPAGFATVSWAIFLTAAGKGLQHTTKRAFGTRPGMSTNPTGKEQK